MRAETYVCIELRGFVPTRLLSVNDTVLPRTIAKRTKSGCALIYDPVGYPPPCEPVELEPGIALRVVSWDLDEIEGQLTIYPGGDDLALSKDGQPGLPEEWQGHWPDWWRDEDGEWSPSNWTAESDESGSRVTLDCVLYEFGPALLPIGLAQFLPPDPQERWTGENRLAWLANAAVVRRMGDMPDERIRVHLHVANQCYCVPPLDCSMADRIVDDPQWASAVVEEARQRDPWGWSLESWVVDVALDRVREDPDPEHVFDVVGCLAAAPGPEYVEFRSTIEEILGDRIDLEELDRRVRKATCDDRSRTGQHESGAPSSALTRTRGDDRPTVLLPGGVMEISVSAKKLGELLAAAGGFYVRGAALTLMEWEGRTPKLRIVTPAMLASALESVARLVRISSGRLQPAICSEQAAKLILNAAAFIDAFPKIRVVSPVPLLAERDGDLVEVTGYDEGSGILAPRRAIDEVPLDKGIDLLRDLMHDFRFATPSDRSRALAAIITPALVLGGLLPGRAPVDLGEADEPQAGKGYRNKLTAAIYGQAVKTITQRKRGVGSIEESFNAALIAGANFICLDNVRGKIDSPAIESFLTEDSYVARMPYTPNVEIDPRRTIVMMTSNRAELTPDLACRSSCVRILKQPPGYAFREFPEGDLLAHVRSNWALYLGAVFAVIKAWHEAGKPGTKEYRHDFRTWAKSLDWIVQKLLYEAPLIEGHRETQDRMSTPALTWLRSVAREVGRAGRFDEWLRAHDILDLILVATNVAVPGLPRDADPEDEATREKLLLAMGRRLAQCFARSHLVVIDRFRIERRETIDDAGRPARGYRFSATPWDGPHVTPTPKPSSRPPSAMGPPSEPPFPPCSAIPAMDSKHSRGTARSDEGGPTCAHTPSNCSVAAGGMADDGGKRGAHVGRWRDHGGEAASCPSDCDAEEVRR